MKSLVFLLTLSCSLTSLADEYFPGPSLTFDLKAKDVKEKFEKTMAYPENFLKRFTPEGAVISDKQVSTNSISFKATKTVLFITKTVLVKGIMDSSENGQTCAVGESGYRLVLRLEGSDSLVADNIDRLEASICFKALSASLLRGSIKSKIYKGNNYSSTTGKFARQMIEVQVMPILKALKEEIQQKP